MNGVKGDQGLQKNLRLLLSPRSYFWFISSKNQILAVKRSVFLFNE